MSRTPPVLNYGHAARRDDVQNIAKYQKVIIMCILCNILIAFANFGMRLQSTGTPLLGLLLVVVYLGVIITSLVYVFKLSIALYSTAVGIILGLLMFVPLVSLIVLLVVNGKATKVLRENGIKVGLLGASMS